MGLRFGTSQERRADVHGARAERQRGGDAAAVADSAGRDDRQIDRIRHARQQREQPDRLPFGRGLIERPAMAAGLESLRDDRVGTGVARAFFASSVVVAVANHAMPFDFARETNDSGKTPMIEDTAVGASSRNLSHCSPKSGRAVRRRGGDLRSPPLQKLADARFRAGVAARRRIRDPRVQLQRSGAVRAEPPAPTRGCRPAA